MSLRFPSSLLPRDRREPGGEDELERLLGIGRRRVLGELGGALHLVPDRIVDRVELSLCGQVLRQDPLARKRNRIALLAPLANLLLRAVLASC